MAKYQGEHYSRALDSGVEAHLVKPPGSEKWKIRSIDVSWGSLSLGSITTKTWFAEPLGIDKLEFDTTDAACAFVESHANVSRAETAIY